MPLPTPCFCASATTFSISSLSCSGAITPSKSGATCPPISATVIGTPVARRASTIAASVSALTVANCHVDPDCFARAASASTSATLSLLRGVQRTTMTGFSFESGMSCSIKIRSLLSMTCPAGRGGGGLRVLRSNARLN